MELSKVMLIVVVVVVVSAAAAAAVMHCSLFADEIHAAAHIRLNLMPLCIHIRC